MKFKLLIFIFFVVFFLAFIRYSYSVSYSDFTTPISCSQIFGNCNLTATNDAINMTGGVNCNGTQKGSYEHIVEVYINASALYPSDPVNVTCTFWEVNRSDTSDYVSEYMWYYDGTNWTTLHYNYSTFSDSTTSGLPRNHSVIFNVNATEGTHLIRCSINAINKNTSNYCVNTSANYYDADDVNFTVVFPLNYTYWNITFANGTVISDGANLTRSDSIRAAANWSKNLSSALVQHNGTGTLSNYTINSSFPGNWTNYTLNFSNATEFNTTGLINISYIWANDSFGLDNSTSPSHYFYLWGYSKVSEISLNQSTIYNGSSVKALCKVIDNVTSLSINGYNVSFYRNDSFLNSSLTNSSGYANISFTDSTTNLPQNYTIKCNITDKPSSYYNASSDNSSNTNISVLNPYEIQVGNVWFNYSGITTNKTNLFTDLTIYANVTDDWRVSTVIANLSYPNGTIINLSMNGTDSSGYNLWNYTFSSQLNKNGTYSVNIIANNSYGIANASTFKTFYVNGTYNLNLSTNYSAYNRGENLTTQVWDVNNFPVYDLDWNITLIKYGLSPTITYPNNTNYTYTINNSDPEGEYTLFVIASKNNNTVANSWQFNVSRNLSLTTSTSQTLSPGNNVEFLVGLNNARGELYNKTIYSNMSCPDGVHNLTFSSGQASQFCIIPSTYSTQFTVTVDVTDNYNNTGTNSITFTTTSAPSSGGGGGGGPISVETKKCSDNTSYNQCSSNRPFYCLNGNLTQNCSICGCNPGYGCQPNGSCILAKEEDFNFTLASEEAEINQGEDTIIIGHLTNTGNTILGLMTFLNVSNNCCNVSVPSALELKEKEEKEFIISIHVPLITSTGEYLIKIGIGTAYFKKEKTVKVTVLKSPYYDYLSQIETTLASLENEIQEYKKSGINVGNAEALIQQAKIVLQNANSSISSDQVNVLANSISDLKNNINYVSTSLTLLRGQRFLSQNSWLIILLIISSILTIYFVPEVFIPLNKVENEIKKFRNEEKNLVSSRVETEKQYFLRKIDENTFSKIMITKQDNILKLRGTIHEKENDRTKILTRTHPKEIAKWFASGIKNLPKNIKKLFMRLIKAPKINLFKGKPKMVI